MHVQGLGTGVMLCDELSQVAQNRIGMQECNPRRPFCVILGGKHVCNWLQGQRICVSLDAVVAGAKKSGRPSRSVHLCELLAVWQPGHSVHRAKTK